VSGTDPTRTGLAWDSCPNEKKKLRLAEELRIRLESVHVVLPNLSTLAKIRK
jgi:hypothetical protein